MTSWTITLPWADRLPITANEARSKVHFRTQHSTKVLVHEAMGWLIRDAGIPPMTARVSLLLTWQMPDRRRRDFDSPSWLLKALADALVVHGVLTDDSWPYVGEGTMRVLPPVRGQAGFMTLEIVEAGEVAA